MINEQVARVVNGVISDRIVAVSTIYIFCVCCYSPLSSADVEVVPRHYNQWKYVWDANYLTPTVPLPVVSQSRREVIKETSIIVNAPVADVFQYYSHVPNHASLQPLIQNMRSHYQRGEGGNNFTVVEYTVIDDMMDDVGSDVIFQVQRFAYENYYYHHRGIEHLPNVTLHVTDRLEETTEGNTQVTEVIELISYRWLTEPALQNEGADQQAFDVIRAYYESDLTNDTQWAGAN